MPFIDANAPPCAQPGATKIPATFPLQGIELQARRLRRRYAFAPKTWRTNARIMFAVEAHA
jgi:hypothetical protein